MNTEAIAFLIPIIFLLSTAAILYYYLQSRNRERIAIIEKAEKVDELKILFENRPRQEASVNRYARWGIVLLSIGLAIMCGVLLEPYTSEGIIPGLIFLFPGIGLMIYYRMFKVVSEKEDSLK